MRKLLLTIGFVISAIVSLGSTSNAYTVRSGHPRVMVMPDSLDVIRARMHDGVAVYDTWKAKITSSAAPDGLPTWSVDYMPGLALLCLLEPGNTTAQGYLNTRMAAAAYSGNQAGHSQVFNRVDPISLAYDWGYTYLTEENKKDLRRRGYTISMAASPETGRSWQRQMNMVLPFIFNGEYDTPDSNTNISNKVTSFLSAWETAASCYQDLYGDFGGLLYYTSLYLEGDLLIEDLLKYTFTDYNGAGLIQDFFNHSPRFSSYYLRSDYAIHVLDSRPNSTNSNFAAKFAMYQTRKNATWVKPWINTLLFTGDEATLNTYSIIFFDPGGDDQNPQDVIGYHYANDFGRYFYNSSWTFGQGNPTTQVLFFSGPTADSDYYRWGNHLTIRRGEDDLFPPSAKWKADANQYNRDYAGSSGANTLHIYMPGENINGGFGTKPNDGGQHIGNTTYFTNCSPDIYDRYGCTMDTLVTGSALEMGAVGDATNVYDSQKCSKALRGIRVIKQSTSGSIFVLCQDYVELVGEPREVWTEWHTINMPTYSGSVTWSTILGNPSGPSTSYGGIFESSNASYLRVEGDVGASLAYFYPCYSNQSPTTRLVGGKSDLSQNWRQSIAPNLALTYDPDHLSYECWMAGTNRPRTENVPDGYSSGDAVSQTSIDDRNRGNWGYSFRYEKTCDWRIEQYLAQATSPVKLLALFEVNDNSIGNRTITVTENAGGLDIIMNGANPIAIHEPILTSAGYVNDLTELTIYIPDAMPAYIYGLEDANYLIRSGLTEIAATSANGSMTFNSTKPGHWAISQIGSDPTGACCDAAGACTLTTNSGCTTVWKGPGTICDPNPCGPLGACCGSGGSCELTLAANCATDWHAEWTVCSPNPCPQLGACCSLQAICELTLETGCAEIWNGSTVCDPNPCTLPNGACCLPSGACYITIEAQCGVAPYGDGTWTYSASPCSPNECFQNPGACCFPDGSCMMTTYDNCGGVWFQSYITCEPNSCAPPKAACCLPDGRCLYRYQTTCEANGWQWLGYPTTCVPNPCAQPPTLGSCCFSNGYCSQITEDECTSNDGLYWIDSGECSPNPCPQPLGACCAVDGSCTIAYEADCTQTATWLGPGTDCDPNLCITPTGACCLADYTCVIMEQTTCEANGFTYNGDDTDCSPNPCLPIAACCTSFGVCTLTTEEDCDYTWREDQTACSPNPCIALGACCSKNGQCRIKLNTECVKKGEYWLGVRTTCSPNICAQATADTVLINNSWYLTDTDSTGVIFLSDPHDLFLDQELVDYLDSDPDFDYVTFSDLADIHQVTTPQAIIYGGDMPFSITEMGEDDTALINYRTNTLSRSRGLPVYFAVGNHDTDYYTNDPPEGYTLVDRVTTWFPELFKNGLPYYYKDVGSIRFLFMYNLSDTLVSIPPNSYECYKSSNLPDEDDTYGFETEDSPQWTWALEWAKNMSYGHRITWVVPVMHRSSMAPYGPVDTVRPLMKKSFYSGLISELIKTRSVKLFLQGDIHVATFTGPLYPTDDGRPVVNSKGAWFLTARGWYVARDVIGGIVPESSILYQQDNELDSPNPNTNHIRFANYLIFYKNICRVQIFRIENGVDGDLEGFERVYNGYIKNIALPDFRSFE